MINAQFVHSAPVVLSSVFSCHRQTNDERSALSDLALELNCSAVFFCDDVMCDGQSLAAALAGFFGGEKRIEDAVADFFGDAGAGIFDVDFGPVAVLPGAERNSAFLSGLCQFFSAIA